MSEAAEITSEAITQQSTSSRYVKSAEPGAILDPVAEVT